MSLTEVSSVLWRERELLDLLLFKLEEEQLLLAAGRTRWLGHATREVEMVVEEIKKAELTRAIEVQAVADTLGLDGDVSLAGLADKVPAPWGDILREHRAALIGVSAEIQSLAHSNKELLTAGYRAAQQALLSLGERDVETYTPDGQSAGRVRGPRLLNEAM
jgi:hypothetical protein